LAICRQTRDDFVLTTPQKSLAMLGASADKSLFFPRIMRFLGQEYCGLGARGAKDKIGSGHADDGFLPRDFTVLARRFCFEGFMFDFSGVLRVRRTALRVAANRALASVEA
jgi:hypothetical protein